MNTVKNKERIYYLLPILLLCIMVPLIVHLKVKPLSGVLYQYWNGQNENLDFFSYYKSIWLIVFAIASLAVLIYKYSIDELHISRTYYLYSSMIFIAFSILSTLFCKYKEVALYGFSDRYEGLYVLIAYMIIMLSAIYLVDNEASIKYILYAVFLSAIVIGIIGLFQYIGYDLWKTNFGKELMLSKQYKSIASKLNFQFGKHQIYATLYNIDYVGSYTAMLLPLSLTLTILLKDKKIKILMLFITVLMFINWIGASSRAGWVGGITAIIILLILINRYIKVHWKAAVLILIITASAFIVFNISTNGDLIGKLSKFTQDLSYTKNNPEDDKSQIPLKNISVNNNIATITYIDSEINIMVKNGQVLFQDAKKQDISLKFIKNKGQIVLLDDRYKDYNIILGKSNNNTVLLVQKNINSKIAIYNKPIKLTFLLGNNKIQLMDNKGNVIPTKTPEAFGFVNKEKIGSSRGYIWSRTFPLLKSTLLIGYGPDTYAIHFPQYDLIGKMYAYNGDMWILVDKPHNFYLQTAVNTGVISLIALLVLFAIYIIKSIKIYFGNEFSDFYHIVGAGVFVAVIGYLVAAIFNDSIVSVAPIFWVLLGCGIAINKIIKPDDVKKELQEEPEA